MAKYDAIAGVISMKNRERFERVIKSDCRGGGAFIDDNGNTCAVGGLLIDLGYTHDELSLVTTMVEMRKCERRVMEVYGLSQGDLGAIYTANDNYVMPAERIEAILALDL